MTNGAVMCLLKRCTVGGPGVVIGGFGVGSIGKGTFTVSGVDVRGGDGGVTSFKGPLVLQNVTVSHLPDYWGIQAFHRLRVTNVTVTNCEVGIRAECTALVREVGRPVASCAETATILRLPG